MIHPYQFCRIHHPLNNISNIVHLDPGKNTKVFGTYVLNMDDVIHQLDIDASMNPKSSPQISISHKGLKTNFNISSITLDDYLTHELERGTNIIFPKDGSRIASLLSPSQFKKLPILEIGTGSGSLTLQLAALGFHVTSIEKIPFHHAIAHDNIVSWQIHDAINCGYPIEKLVGNNNLSYTDPSFRFNLTIKEKNKLLKINTDIEQWIRFSKYRPEPKILQNINLLLSSSSKDGSSTTLKQLKNQTKFSGVIIDNVDPTIELEEISTTPLLQNNSPIISFLPNITQVLQISDYLRTNPKMHFEKVFEITEKQWKLEPNDTEDSVIKGICRPDMASKQIGHTGFVIVCRYQI